MSSTYPPVTIGVVTHTNSFIDFAGFLIELTPAIAVYPGPCQLVVANNSGDTAARKTKQQLEISPINTVCHYSVVATSENNIATGRNAILESAEYALVAFLDDDEFPSINWLTNLVNMMKNSTCAAVAGPAIPIYLFPAPKWVRQVNLHGAQGKVTGQSLRKCSTANVIVDMQQCGAERFDPEYGRTGGEDTDFFLRMTSKGLSLLWCNEAEVYEYIPEHKSSSQYMIKRSVLQGILNREILVRRGEISSIFLFKVRSFFAMILCFIIGGALLCMRHHQSGNWIKRGFGNIGHILSSESTLYS